MIHFQQFYQSITNSPLQSWLETIPAKLAHWQTKGKHGDTDGWLQILGNLPELSNGYIELTNAVAIGKASDVDDNTRKRLTGLLQKFKPWRKGPFHLFGIDIDAEWQSNLKWQRLLPHISKLAGRRVLDVGCGNGYYMWRMLGEKAAQIVGVDPTDLYFIQFLCLHHYIQPSTPVHLLPLKGEDLPPSEAFDTVFSMGILGHRHSPIDHLLQLKSQLRPGGELVLETLIIEGQEKMLVPPDRYANMPNVWFIPSIDCLTAWLKKCGFLNIRCVDVCTTTTEEQRHTEWTAPYSLADGLNQQDSSLTIEGHPRPTRVIVIANTAL